MAFRIDDDENRIQDLKDQIDQLEIQTFSPEVVARNESTRNTGVQTGDAAATNAYPQWMPIRDFGSVGSITLDILLNRTDSHVAKLTAIGDIDFAFSLPPGTNKMMEFILDVTVDAIGGYTFNLLNDILPAGISINNNANARTVIRFTTTDGGVTYYAENISIAGGGGDVPDGTAAFQHLEWDGFAWIAQQALAFGGGSATSGQINFPNNTIGVAWRNATNDGNLELKATIAGNLDITRDDDTAISLSIRSQNAIELDQFLSFTVGSGSVTTADCIIDASTARLLFAAGGSTRLTLDTLVNTALTLKSPTGITAQSVFDIISTHVSEADQFLSLFVGSGAAINVDAVIDTSAAKLKFTVGGANRLTIDTTVTTAMTLASPSGITAQSSFDVVSTHISQADQNIGIFVGSGDAADAVLTTSANIFKLAVDNIVRWELDVNIGNEITQTGFGVNPLYDFFNDDSTPNDFDLLGRINFSGRNSNSDKIIYGGIFVESTDVTDNTEDATMFFSIIDAGIILPKLTLKSDGMVLATGSIQLDEILLPSNPPLNTGLIYLRDVAGITTPFFLDSVGTETSLIGGGSSPLTTKGDLFGFSTVDARIPVGTDGQILTANSAVTLGVEWQTPSSFDATGLQDFKLSLDHETPEYDFEIWVSNAKQGNTDFDTTAPVYNPILVSTQFYLPIYIGQRCNVVRVGVDVGFVDFDDMAMAIYDSQPLQNYPNQRIGSVVTGSIVSTGILDLFFAQNLEAGLYFFSFWIDGNAESATFLFHPASSANTIGWRPEFGDNGPMLPINGFLEVGVTQSLPSSAPADMIALPQEVLAIFAKLIPNTS